MRYDSAARSIIVFGKAIVALRRPGTAGKVVQLLDRVDVAVITEQHIIITVERSCSARLRPAAP